MNPGDYTDLTQPPPSAGLPDLGTYTAYTLVPKRRAPSEDSDTPIEYVELIYDEDEQEVPSTFVPQPPVEVHKISFEELTPSSIVCEWKDVQRPEDVDLSFETWRRRIYCLGFRNADRISGRVVYPKDKTYLRGVEWGVTLNPYVAGAFMRGGHMVKQADFPDGTQFYGKLAMHYGLPSYTPPQYYAAFPELEDPTKITKMQNLARDQPTLDNPDQLEPGHGYLVGGYWIKMWNIDSSELGKISTQSRDRPSY